MQIMLIAYVLRHPYFKACHGNAMQQMHAVESASRKYQGCKHKH